MQYVYNVNTGESRWGDGSDLHQADDFETMSQTSFSSSGWNVGSSNGKEMDIELVSFQEKSIVEF